MIRSRWIVSLICILIYSSSFAQTIGFVENDTLTVFQLDEIVVTASRGGGEALSLPMAITVISKEEIANSRMMSLDDALKLVPGVLTQSRSGGQDVRLTIRGFGARGNGDRSNAATVRGIRVLLDGIPETEPDGRTSLDLIDMLSISKIEVIRTNVSTLFGNASGGIINVETIPVFSEPFIEFRSSFGSFALRRNNIRLGFFTGNGKGSLSFTDSEFGGWRNHSGSKSIQIHSALEFPLSEKTNLSLFISGSKNTFEIPGPLTHPEYVVDPERANPLYESRKEGRDNRQGRFALKTEHIIDENSSLNFLAYYAPKMLQRSERNTFRDFNRYHAGGGVTYIRSSKVLTVPIRLAFGGDIAYQDGTILFYNLLNGERGDSLRTNKSEGAGTYGFFINGEMNFTEVLSLTIGGRFDGQDYRSELLPAGSRNFPSSAKLSLSHFTPRLALTYRLTEHQSLYFSLSGGVEAPAFNEVDPPKDISASIFNPFLKPMASTTYEIGTKGVDKIHIGESSGVLSYSAALYHISISNEIVPFDGGAWFFSAGSSRRKGGEIGGSIHLRNGFGFKGALNYIRTEYTSYVNELGTFNGKKVAGIPELAAHWKAYYQTQKLHLDFGLDHVGSYFADDANRVEVPSYLLLSGSAGYFFSISGFDIRTTVGIQNIANEKYVASSFINPSYRNIGSVSLPAFIEPGLPRNMFFGLSIKREL